MPPPETLNPSLRYAINACYARILFLNISISPASETTQRKFGDRGTRIIVSGTTNEGVVSLIRTVLLFVRCWVPRPREKDAALLIGYP
jgi:hypothetical protein